MELNFKDIRLHYTKNISVAINFKANLEGIGVIVAKIKAVIKKLYQLIDKAVNKMVGFGANKARAFIEYVKKGNNQWEKNKYQHLR